MADNDSDYQSCTNCVHQSVCYIHEKTTNLFLHDDMVCNAMTDLNMYSFIAQYCKYFNHDTQ